MSKSDGTAWTTYTMTNGLANIVVWAIAINSAGNKRFGTDGGVSKFGQGTLDPLPSSQPLIVRYTP